MRSNGGPVKIDRVKHSAWSALSQSAVLATVQVSQSGRIVAANARFADVLGAPDSRALLGRDIAGLLAGDRDRALWAQVWDSRVATGLELSFKTATGAARWLRGDLHCVDSEPAGATLDGIFVDVSEELSMRGALQRGARLEALGNLTSGVAHDFNNLLTVLVGNLSLAAEEVRTQGPLFAKLKSARDAARRGADLIRQLLSFARRESVESDVVDPCRVVEDLIPLLQRALGTRIELGTDLEPGAGPILGNHALLESVIVNLAVNARDAVGGHGKVLLRVRNICLTRAAARGRGLEGGDYVRISVTDNGSGIAPDVIERVFEPFFSTKHDSGGTGLGLSMVRSFAEQLNGAAFIDSELGNGATVNLLLPLCVDRVEETAARTMPLSTLPTGDEHVLVLSSEDGLRATVRQILEVLGYKVELLKSHSDLTSALAAQHANLLIVDGTHARDFGGALQPPAHLRTILLTAGADLEGGQAAAWSGILQKPFSLADLAGIVRKTMDGALDDCRDN